MASTSAVLSWNKEPLVLIGFQSHSQQAFEKEIFKTSTWN
jgi:hypothetical protein